MNPRLLGPVQLPGTGVLVGTITHNGCMGQFGRRGGRTASRAILFLAKVLCIAFKNTTPET